MFPTPPHLFHPPDYKFSGNCQLPSIIPTPIIWYSIDYVVYDNIQFARKFEILRFLCSVNFPVFIISITSRSFTDEILSCFENLISCFHSFVSGSDQGWRQEFSDGGLTSDEGAKYGFQGTKNAKNLRKNRCSPSDGGL